MYLLHFTPNTNLPSILNNGLKPNQATTVNSHRSKRIYFTDSIEFIHIMIEDILHDTLDNYAVLFVDVTHVHLTEVWWEGKGYKEWYTTTKIDPCNISLHKTFPSIIHSTLLQ